MRVVHLVMTASILVLAISVPASVRAQKPAAQTKVATLRVPDMFCGGCEVAVKRAAKKVDGVTEVTTNSDKRIADVTYDPAKTNAEAIAAAITKNSGFKAQAPKGGGK
jgi:mercuric ion binding protein